MKTKTMIKTLVAFGLVTTTWFAMNTGVITKQELMNANYTSYINKDLQTVWFGKVKKEKITLLDSLLLSTNPERVVDIKHVAGLSTNCSEGRLRDGEMTWVVVDDWNNKWHVIGVCNNLIELKETMLNNNGLFAKGTITGEVFTAYNEALVLNTAGCIQGNLGHNSLVLFNKFAWVYSCDRNQ